MKKLFLFYMIIASTVSYVGAQDDKDDQNLVIDDHLRSDIVNNDHGGKSIEEDYDFNLDDITREIENIESTRAKPTYYDYAKVAVCGWYLYCIQKPYRFCKTSLYKLGIYFKKRTRHGI